MCYSVLNDSIIAGEDGKKERRQQDHLELLLAEQLVVDEFARGSNPEQTLASHVMRSTTSMAVLLRAALNAAPQLERPLLWKIQNLLLHVLHGGQPRRQDVVSHRPQRDL